MLDKVSYLSNLLSMGLGLVLVGALTQTLGDDYSFYVLAVSLMSLFSFDFGLGTAVGRLYTQELQLESDTSSHNSSIILGDYFQIIAIFVLPLLVIAVLVTCTSIDLLFPNLDPGTSTNLQTLLLELGLPSTLVSVALSGVDGFYAGQGRMMTLRVINMAFRFLHVTLFICLLFFTHDCHIAITCQILALPLLRLVKLSYFATFYPIAFRALSLTRVRKFSSFFGWITLSMIADRFFLSIIPSVLTRYNLSHEVKFYGVVSSVTSNFYALGKSLNGNYIKPITTFFLSRNLKSLNQTLNRYSGNQILVLGAIFMLFCGFGQIIFPVWVGPEFVLLIPYISLVLSGILVFLIAEIFYELIYAGDHVHIRAIVFILASAANLTLLHFLARPFGIAGVCTSIFLTYILVHSFLLFLFSSSYLSVTGTYVKQQYQQYKITYAFIFVGVVLQFLTKCYWVHLLWTFAFFAVHHNHYMTWIKESLQS